LASCDLPPKLPPLDRARLEKALNDYGFDLTPVLDGDWLVGRSTQHPVAVRLFPHLDGAIALAADDKTLGATMANLEGSKLIVSPAGPAWQLHCPDFESFYRTLGRVASLARSLPNRVAERFNKVTASLPKTTEAERLVVQRVGQNLFREALIDYWQGRCAVTGLDVVPLLRASHIKPWADCDSDEERLDVFNGLLLAPHLDALFDGGWIGFSEQGDLLISPGLGSSQLKLLGVSAEWKLSGLAEPHLAYLDYHRGHVFRS
jgi:putative restriction endonuclease